MSQGVDKASANQIMVMVDERTGEKDGQAAGHEGMGKDQDMEWLIKDMSNELKVWSTAGNVILKSDGEPAILAVRDALAYKKGQLKVNAHRTDSSRKDGKTVRESVRVLKDRIEVKTNVKLKYDDLITLGMIRWAGDGIEVHGRKQLRAEKGQSMQSTSSHVRRESPVQADPRAERAQG